MASKTSERDVDVAWLKQKNTHPNILNHEMTKHFCNLLNRGDKVPTCFSINFQVTIDFPTF